MLNVGRLRLLREIAERGSFSAAADALSYSPSGVSQHAATLEREAGVRLFERSPRGVRLTDAGEALMRHAEVALRALGDARAELDAIAGLSAGRLRIGSFPTATAVFVADVIERFRRRHPGVALHHEDGEPFETLARVRSRELDLAIAFDFDHWHSRTDYGGAQVAHEAELDWVDLFDDPFYLVLPENHRLSRLGVVPIAELEGETVLGGAPWRTDFEFLCRRAGFEPQFDASYHSTDFQVFQTLVANGQGATLMPGLSLTTVRSDLAVRPLTPAVVRHVGVATAATAYRTPAAEGILSILAEVLSELAYEVQGAPDTSRIVRPLLAHRPSGLDGGIGVEPRKRPEQAREEERGRATTRRAR